MAEGQAVQCQRPSCFEQGWRGAKYCQKHFLFAEANPKSINPRKRSAGLLFNLEESTGWTHQNQAFDKITGRDRNVKVVCLDLEFSSTSRKIFEVGIIDFDSNKTSIDARIKHDCTDAELHQPIREEGSKSKDIHAIRTAISRVFSGKVYGLHRQKCTNLRDVHCVARQARESGITPDTIILVWHKTYLDLSLLREFFEEAGYHNILPLKENCVPMIPLFGQSLPKGCPLSLEIIFPMIFNGHEFVGRNHRALVDSLQLLLMGELFEELCKPASERDLSFLPDKIRSWLDQGKKGMIQQDLDQFVTRVKHKNESADPLSSLSEEATAQQQQHQTIPNTAFRTESTLEKYISPRDDLEDNIFKVDSEDASRDGLGDDSEDDTWSEE